MSELSPGPELLEPRCRPIRANKPLKSQIPKNSAEIKIFVSMFPREMLNFVYARIKGAALCTYCSYRGIFVIDWINKYRVRLNLIRFPKHHFFIEIWPMSSLGGRCLNLENLLKICKQILIAKVGQHITGRPRRLSVASLKEMSGLTVRHFIARVDLFAALRVLAKRFPPTCDDARSDCPVEARITERQRFFTSRSFRRPRQERKSPPMSARDGGGARPDDRPVWAADAGPKSSPGGYQSRRRTVALMGAPGR
jgi:hypothetical protein